MLKQILADMYIDPELLAELSEEQKQILFFKMREEQIRRWKEREAKLEQKEAMKIRNQQKKASKKSVNWRLGADEEVWVWVMGEHTSDKSYDIVCDEIISERARKQAEKEAEERRKAQDEELAKFTKALTLQTQIETVEKWKKTVENKKVAREEAKLAEQERINEEIRKKEMALKVQEKESERLEDRTQEIYMNWKEAQDVKQKLEKEDKEWQESLRKSKAADERRRSIAKQARDDYKRLSMQAIERGQVAERAKNFGEVKRPPLPPKPNVSTAAPVNYSNLIRRQGVRRVNSSSTRENIIKWFKEEQLPLRAGCDKSGTYIAPWFHGIISRLESEELLKSQVPGSFLLRVSEKIHGYVLTYRSDEGYMHFMIDASGTSFSFLGVDQLQHATLADLVEYHKAEPITSLGKELLLYPCDQQGQHCDYSDLFE
ncbi:SH2 domain-containing protein 4A isoform X2 [Bombina bombina]|uniref:SH2 domain-containing protein 4A isoform X2 n=1 Tax=Bombina bombina TaxID=8345 RepID=UPI00235A8F1C|nr:SH2 domain-containing protein 4A isoform X2 [Bombina bombina]